MMSMAYRPSALAVGLLSVGLALGSLACGSAEDISLGTHHTRAAEADAADGEGADAAPSDSGMADAGTGEDAKVDTPEADSGRPNGEPDNDGPTPVIDAGGPRDGNGHPRGGSGGSWQPPTQEPPPEPVVCGPFNCQMGMVCCDESCGLCWFPGLCSMVSCVPPPGQPPTGCSEWECGFAPPIYVICADGTVAGAVCVRNDVGICEWKMTDCPEPPSDPCGGCPAHQYCEVENCGRDGEPGECRDRLQECDRNSDPVCGCDGQTYPNGCVANGYGGTSVDFDGVCPEEEPVG